VWDAVTRKRIATLEGHTDIVNSAAFSLDGQRIVTASYDDSARVWDAVTGKQIAALEGHTSRVNSAAFSPDGKRVVTASDDRTARIWDAVMGKQIAALEGHTGTIWEAAFSPDGKRVVTASDDRTARIWDVSQSTRIVRSLAIALTATLAHGVGWCTALERNDLQMQDASEQFNGDLYAEAHRQLLDPEKYSPEEIVRRERLLEEAIAELRAPLHPNCYLSPTQFLERSGLLPQKPRKASLLRKLKNRKRGTNHA
jgi:predicted oxidoreductase (fatty acid repression mutant protein)